MIFFKKVKHEEDIDALKRENEELLEKHWSECVQISKYDEESRKFKKEIENYRVILLDLCTIAPEAIAKLLKKYEAEEKAYSYISEFF